MILTIEAKRTGIKALSLVQPWAWLIVHGYKDIENRTWQTKHRGLTYIHASQKCSRADYDAAERLLDQYNANAPYLGFLPPFKDLPRGGLVGLVNFTGCVSASNSLWFCGPYGFTLDQPRPITFTPCKGALSFFTPDATPPKWSDGQQNALGRWLVDTVRKSLYSGFTQHQQVTEHGRFGPLPADPTFLSAADVMIEAWRVNGVDLISPPDEWGETTDREWVFARACEYEGGRRTITFDPALVERWPVFKSIEVDTAQKGTPCSP